jgi:hypothetical protein
LTLLFDPYSGVCIDIPMKTREQTPDNYCVTGKPGIYIKPEEFQGDIVVVYQDSDREWHREWKSDWVYEGLEVRDMSNRYGLRISSLLVLHEEFERYLSILWKRPDDQDINITVCPVMNAECDYVRNDESE